MVASEVHYIPQISVEENCILASDFEDKKVFEAVIQMKKNKAPRSDVFYDSF
jgi:hypothetical protein